MGRYVVTIEILRGRLQSKHEMEVSRFERTLTAVQQEAEGKVQRGEKSLRLPESAAMPAVRKPADPKQHIEGIDAGSVQNAGRMPPPAAVA